MFAALMLLGPLIVKWGIKLLAALGIGFATYTGFDLLLEYITDELIALLNGLPEDLLMLMLISKFDVYLNIILSAYAIKLTIKGVSNGMRKFSL